MRRAKWSHEDCWQCCHSGWTFNFVEKTGLTFQQILFYFPRCFVFSLLMFRCP
jgi:hypothetical protein